MKKRFRRICSMLLAVAVVVSSPAIASSAASDGVPVDATTAAENPAAENSVAEDPEAEKALAAENKEAAEALAGVQEVPTTEDGSKADAGTGSSIGTDVNKGKDQNIEGDKDTNGEDKKSTESTEVPSTEKEEVSGKITVDSGDVTGKVTVETDKNDDNVTIKKHDKPYLALGTDLKPDQQATVLSLMGISPDQLSNYDVVYVNNTEEHQYLDSYIEKSKIGTKSLSSVVIVERGDKNGINISTSNISYCTVGMYKNALATAGIQNADIIVAAPFAISGTAALVGIFKAYKEMTGEEVEQKNVDAALNELVVTGALESSTGASADEVEGMIAYIKQKVVEHDMTDEDSIRQAIEEGCSEFDITLTEDEKNEIVALMLKIGSLDLDLDSLLNSAQSIYDKIANGDDNGFFDRFMEFISKVWDKVKGLFD